VGHSFLEFGKDTSHGRELLEQLAKKETVRNLRMTRKRKDGTIVHVLIDATSFWSENEFQYSSIFLRDVTDRLNLEREVLHVSEREHRRIAQDLHDGLGQLLVGTVYLINTLQKDLAAKAVPEARRLTRIMEVINEAIWQTRTLARGLHPVEPEPNGLMSALETLAVRTKKMFRVPCHFTCRRPVMVADNAVATHLFRIAQEAVTNAIKHASPGRIEIRLTETPGHINLAIRDDGSGMPARRRKSAGMGLRIMRYRAGMIGGSVAVQKEAGGGTTVVCTVHLTGDAAKNVDPKTIRRKTLRKK
jgi:signal transduction histidine kinase